ncbi:MAG: FkbM family methyltransferase [Anaerolineaceae bacterium]
MNRSLKEFIRRFLPHSIRPYRILSGFLKGRIIFTSLHDYPAAIHGITESNLVAWMIRNVKLGEVWLDVGAHYGYISLALSLLTGREGKVYAFEPIITTAGYLNLTRQANDLTQMVIIPMALGASGGPNLIRLPVTRGMADSTLETSRDFENILLMSLDKLWKELADSKEEPAGIKIDVQGMELDVLTGMQSLLRVHKPKLLLEFHIGVDRSQITALLESCDYKIPGTDISSNLPVTASSYLDNTTYLFIPKE